MVAACSSKPWVIKAIKDAPSSGAKIYVVSHGWHTGFVVPAEGMKKLVPELAERFGDAPFIEFGWGDKGFYQSAEITTGLTLQAIFWPTESVIHAVSVPEKIKSYFSGSELKEVSLDGAEHDALLRFISGSFYKDAEGKVSELKRGIYGDSQFYKGMGDYYLMNTCNKWTAKGLKSAGLDVSPTFMLSAGSVMSALED
ncbi:TIGR02117 family protein [Myxococcota bacterium]|nr:TIGR02117 family protein [Myxococcota bacterium]